MLFKYGESIEISKIESIDSCISMVDPQILENFRKVAVDLKKIAPRAEDFLYFSAVMMHAAESSSLNDDGTIKLSPSGKQVKVGWDKSNNTWKWESSDPNIRPYKNSNGDIFPEEELIKAHKKWVHKPLCIDHKSSSVDHVRGFIVDTYYDRNLKRVIALCALDKHNYPDLARKVSTGYSNCVSMGTAVGRAICAEHGCARVARAEADFCQHMKNKSGYGEINIDLNPIELSIVVNGADPKASIKHIIAAANTLNSYVEQKEKEFKKIADVVYSASFSVADPSKTDNGNSTHINISSSNLETFKSDIDNACQKLAEINTSFKNSENNTNDTAFNQSSGTVAMDETSLPNTDSGLAPPAVRYASMDDVEVDSIAELREVTMSIEAKLNQMKQSLDKLSNISINTQEETMSGSNDMNKKGYYQGTEEPTPGQPKYTKDPLNENLREKEDKQMVGQSPFPGVGPVDGMHPSPESAEPSNELERKKMLARAEAEERALRRNAIVNLAKKALEDKTAYHQGGGGPNEPVAKGKVQYPVDKLNEQARDYEDKQMVGQKPFPGVGSVDGLHPSPSSADVSDELKRKELLQRASLRARFVKAANADGSTNLGKSAWEVFRGEDLLLTASVDDLSGGRSEVLYDSIATKEFGTKLIEKVKVQGANKVRSLIKSAQTPPVAPPAEAAPAEVPVEEPQAEDTGKDGDPKATAMELAEKVRDLGSDLVDAVRGLTGEKAEMGAMEEAAPEGGMAATASDQNFSSATLNNLRKELNGALTGALKEAIAELNDHQQELEMIVGMYDKGAVTASNEEFVGSIVEDAINEAKESVADGFKLMTAFVKYARGTKAIVKRAEIEAELEALAEGDTTMSIEQDSHSSDDLMSLISDTNSDLDAVTDMISDDNNVDPQDDVDLVDAALVEDDNDIQAKQDELKNLTVKPGTVVEVTASYGSKEGRAALRAKLAADTLKTSPHLHEAHPKGGFTTQLDVKPEGDLAKVEDLEETHEAMLDLANAPPKVRKEAEAIHKLISEGKLDPADLNALVSEGLDKDAVSYYKKYFGQVDGGGEFASELVKEHVKAQIEEELNKFRVKMARAYELAYDMVDRGLCHADRTAVSSQVDEIMKFNDDSFESLKRVVARHAPTMRKEAGRMPQVGMIGSGEVNTTTASSEGDMFSQLNAVFSKNSKRLF